MKHLKAWAVAILIGMASTQSDAQNVRETAVKINKTEQKGIAADYAYPKSLVETSLAGKFTKAGFGKSKSKKGFDVHSGVTWTDVAPTDKLDVWIKTEEKKGNTTLTVLISRGYDNYMTAATDPAQIENLKNFLNNLSADLAAADLSQKIEEQQRVVKAAEEKTTALKKEQEKLLSEKKKLEKSIEQNEEAQKKSAADRDAEQSKLEALRAQQGK